MRLDDLRAGFADPPVEAAPMMRWWWFGPAVERDELARELTAMARAGFGGAEVAYVYPLGPATTTFLSAEFLADLRFAAEFANDLGLRFDLTLGSGWSFGGPHITTELAARQLRWERREIDPGRLDVRVTSPWPGDDLVAAYIGAGSIQESPDSFAALPIEDGHIRVPEGEGTRQVLIAYAQRTGQNVKRAAVGAEGPVFDHYCAEATAAHLAAVGDRLLDAVPAELLGSVFCDSLEVYGADWTPDLPQEFAKRRGYPLLPVLHRLVTDTPDDGLRADYHRTLAELYEENFIAVVRRWAAGRGVPFRIQNYGTPPGTLSSYRSADLFEGEGWGRDEVTQTRWASSAAHLYGRTVVSAEVWTWVHSPSFRATPLDLKGEAHEHLVNGINQLIGHGWPYSPSGAPGLGWFFYAAGALDDRNPWWPAMPELNAYLTRLCWLLRQGQPIAEVAIYLPTEDLFATMGTATGGSLDTWREANRRIPRAIPAAIRTAGLDYDVIDDDALFHVPADRYRVVIVPPTSAIPDDTVSWLRTVADHGGSVISADNLGALATVKAGLSVSPTTDIGMVHRRLPDADIHLVVNTGPRHRTVSIGGRGFASWWDPATGEVRGVEPELSLHPYETAVIVLTGTELARPRPTVTPDRWLPLDGPWEVSFAEAPPQPVSLPHVWEDDPARRHFSGAATYTTTFEVDGEAVTLDLGNSRDADPAPGGDHAGMVGRSFRALIRPPVGEIAEVRINGVECGIAWAPPYRVDISAATRSGSNDVRITVHNTAANALAADEHILRVAAESEARHGRRFRMQELDRAMDGVRSGLLHTPAIGLITSRPGSPTPRSA